MSKSLLSYQLMVVLALAIVPVESQAAKPQAMNKATTSCSQPINLGPGFDGMVSDGRTLLLPNQNLSSGVSFLSVLQSPTSSPVMVRRCSPNDIFAGWSISGSLITYAIRPVPGSPNTNFSVEVIDATDGIFGNGNDQVISVDTTNHPFEFLVNSTIDGSIVAWEYVVSNPLNQAQAVEYRWCDTTGLRAPRCGNGYTSTPQPNIPNIGFSVIDFGSSPNFIFAQNSPAGPDTIYAHTQQPNGTWVTTPIVTSTSNDLSLVPRSGPLLTYVESYNRNGQVGSSLNFLISAGATIPLTPFLAGEMIVPSSVSITIMNSGATVAGFTSYGNGTNTTHLQNTSSPLSYRWSWTVPSPPVPVTDLAVLSTGVVAAYVYNTSTPVVQSELQVLSCSF